MPHAKTSSETLEGTLEHIVYTNEDNGFSVVRLSVDNDVGEVTAVGKLLGVQPGENLRLTGRWVRDKRFGRQFEVTSYRTVQPSTVVGIERYLGSGLIPGIGPVMARRLVRAFGLETLEVIENHPERLAQVPGIGPKRREEIRKAWAEQQHIKDLMVFLQSHGVSTNLAIKIYKAYGEEALAVVRSEPFRLARDLHGVGFLTADRVASSLGLPKDSPQRLRAGVLHVLSEAGNRGHLYLPRRELERSAAELLGVEAAQLEGIIDALAGLAVHLEPLPGEPETAVYPAALHTAETGVAERIHALLEHRARPVEIKVPAALRWFERRESLELAAEQRRAVEMGLTAKVLVVTGGPGTGKTTLIRGIVEILTRKELKVQLAAPTGRAAKRLSEACGGHDARTIHRLLEFDPHTGSFLRGPDRPLAGDVLILDEVSMLDVVLAHRVLEAVADEGRLILVGDVDQLPSVGPGRVLSDLIDSGAVEVVRLTEIFRQARESLIVTNAHRIRKGEMPQLAPATRAGEESPGDFFFIERHRPEKVVETVTKLVTRRIPEHFGLDPIDDIQLLTPMNRGPLGTEQLNRTLRELLNPVRSGEPEVARGSRSFRIGDKVMQIRNNYELGVFNGDLGRIEAIDEEEGEVRVAFDERTVTHELASLDELTLAYAVTIHKSQGSEYPCVVLPIHSQHWVMLQRNLLYTALTRARRLAVLVGERRALGAAVRNVRTEERYSLLAERLAGRLGGKAEGRRPGGRP